MYKNLCISISLLFIIGLAIWTTLFSYHPQKNPLVINLLPDAYMENVSATIMDKAGNVKLKIITPKMVHYLENDTSQLTSPRVILYRHSPEPWIITSKHAKAEHGLEEVNFWDNVVIHHSADGKTQDTLINTATLKVFPNKQIAQTADAIILNQPNLMIKAVGMFADMDTGKINLLSQARGEYEPG